MAKVSTVVVPKPEFDALVAENARLREESDDWQKKAILHWSVREDLEAENARLREASTKDRQTILLQNVDLARLREDYAGYKKQTEAAWARHQDEVTELREKLAEAVRRLEDADHHWREIHGVATHEALL